jgi:hypothetical protein
MTTPGSNPGRRGGNSNPNTLLFETVGLGLFATDEVSTFRAGGRLIQSD